VLTRGFEQEGKRPGVFCSGKPSAPDLVISCSSREVLTRGFEQRGQETRRFFVAGKPNAPDLVISCSSREVLTRGFEQRGQEARRFLFRKTEPLLDLDDLLLKS
jgi:hypothetical protein